jgi:hypothetical protein
MTDATAGTSRTAARSSTEVRSRASDSFGDDREPESKPSYMTSELWVTLAGLAALIVTYNVADEPSFNLFDLCLLCTIAGMAYVVSRGLAKAGVRRGRHDSYYTEASYR